jgi:hypothetical protein
MLAEEAAAAEMLRQAARQLRKARPAAQPAGGGLSPFSSPKRVCQRLVQPPLWGTTGASPPGASPPDPPRISETVSHHLAAAEHQQSSDSPAVSSQQADPSDTCRQTAAAADAGTSSAASDSAEITSGEMGRLPAAAENISAAIAEEPSGPPLAVDSLPVRRRAKLESLDKLIGQQPDVVRCCHQQGRLFLCRCLLHNVNALHMLCRSCMWTPWSGLTARTP